MLAAELKMDPAELRLKNFVGNDEFPLRHRHRTLLRQRRLCRAAARRRWTTVELHEACARSRQKARASRASLMGIGISTYGEICAIGPSPAMPAGRLGERHGEDRAVAARSR